MFSLAISITIGDQFRPNPLAFILVFFATRFAIYQVWFVGVSKKKTPWLRLLAQSIILLVVLPTLVAIAAFIFQGLANILFWFTVVPIVGTATSLALHYYYKLS
ncbi:MAG TPA: hypothetical protein VF303_03370 [Candidatus Nanoarchaeia archaeon]